MDKTGTITMGEPEVAKVYPISETSERDLLMRAAALEARSSHPLARAILSRAKQDSLSFVAADNTRTVPGRGLEGELQGQVIWLGSDRFAEEKGFGRAISAELRQGIKKIVMLTGDNAATAKAVATEVGIDEVRAELLPEDKVTAIEELVAQYATVAMIGDGVNDAPAMARAHYGIAMGAVGPDAAIETADIALMTDDIGKVPWLIGHSRRTMSIIKQNIGLSLATKAVFVVATAFGMASMWGAIAADVGVSLLVVANALRLLQARDEPAGERMGGKIANKALAHEH